MRNLSESEIIWHNRYLVPPNSDLDPATTAIKVNYLMRIGLISDTHHYLDPAVAKYFADCDEIWHAGDLGTIAITDELRAIKPLRAVFGNIDGPDVRSVYPETLIWACEGVNVMMTHIGGYPGKYAKGLKTKLRDNGIRLFVCGHSHITKIMYDDSIGCLHINPGAAGRQGWHKVRTLVRLTIDGEEMRDCEVVEL
jgi:putative phosphoesterase